MRFTCEIPGFEDNWIEVDERWTRKEGKELYSLPEIQAFNKYFPLKVIGCHIIPAEGEPFTDPQKVTYDALDDVDARVFGFVARTLFAAYAEQQRLGNASARLSSNGSGQTRIAAPTTRTN